MGILRAKGGVRLGFYVSRGSRVFRGGPGEMLRPGDALQFTVALRKAGYLAILSVDGSDQASIYYPEGAKAAWVAAGEQTLPQSTVLDDVLGTERLYAFVCVRPFKLEPLRKLLAVSGSAAPKKAECEVDSLEVEKVSP